MYFKQVWALIRQERLFSTIYIMGTGLAISMVMALAVAYHVRTANIAPEVHRDRMAYLGGVTYKLRGQEKSFNAFCGPRLAKDALRGLVVPEAVTLSTNPMSMAFLYGNSFMRLPGGDDSPKIDLKGCDAMFWKVYKFDFLDGSPFTEADFESGLPCVVLSRDLARRLFGRVEVAGQTVLLDEMEYRVSGVVSDVSGITSDVYAQAWVTYSSLASVMEGEHDERGGSAGMLDVAFLLGDASDLVALSAELRQAVRRYNATLVEGEVSCDDPFSFGSKVLGGLLGTDTYIVLGVLVLLFLLVPALNLSGLNASRMQDRMGELGVRKAFGAPRRTIMEQIFVENLLLTLPGGAVGLLLAFALVYAYRGIFLSSLFNMMTGIGGELSLAPGMLLNGEVFAYAFMACLALNLLSSMVPAWRIVRVNITDALNG